MQLYCKSCGKEIRAEDIHLENTLAKCRSCNAVFDFSEQIEGPEGGYRERGPVPMPKGLHVEEMGSTLDVTRRWFHPAILGLLVFCVLWDGFLLVWYFLGITKGAPLLFLIFPVLHVAVGVGLTYFVIASFVNRTRIRVGAGELGIRHGPVPWPGNRILSTNDMDQLYTREHTGRKGGATWSLFALTRSGKRIRLLSNLTSAEQGLFLEQTIEGRLGLRDRRVAGEMRR